MSETSRIRELLTNQNDTDGTALDPILDELARLDGLIGSKYPECHRAHPHKGECPLNHPQHVEVLRDRARQAAELSNWQFMAQTFLGMKPCKPSELGDHVKKLTRELNANKIDMVRCGHCYRSFAYSDFGGRGSAISACQTHQRHECEKSPTRQEILALEANVEKLTKERAMAFADADAALAERDAARAESADLRAQALRFYHANGTFEVLSTPGEVVARRRNAALKLKVLETKLNLVRSLAIVAKGGMLASSAIATHLTAILELPE